MACPSMASDSDLEKWKALGGKLEEAPSKKGGKKGSNEKYIFVTPTGG